MTAKEILHEKTQTATQSDRAKINNIFQQLSVDILNFKVYTHTQAQILKKIYSDKIQFTKFSDSTLRSFILNVVSAKIYDSLK